MLALVFVDTLDLDVKQPTGIKLNPGMHADIRGKPLLVRLLDRAPLMSECVVIDKGLELAEQWQFHWPPIADGSIQQLAQPGIGKREESARRDPVGLVAESFRPQLIEIL